MSEKEPVNSVILNLENGKTTNLEKGILVECNEEKLVKINIFNLNNEEIIKCLIGLESFLNEKASKIFENFQEEMEKK